MYNLHVTTLRLLAGLGLAAIATAPVLASGPTRYDHRQSNDAQRLVGLSAYVVQTIASLKPSNQVERELCDCVDLVTQLVPGGGDAFSQQKAIGTEMPLSQLMLRGLNEAARLSPAAAECSSRLSNLAIRFQDPKGHAVLHRNGVPASSEMANALSEHAGRLVLCVSGLTDVASAVIDELRRQPTATEQEAVLMAGRVIAEQLRVATTRAYRADPSLARLPTFVAQGNNGSTAPFYFVVPGAIITGGDGAKVKGGESSGLVKETQDYGDMAVGGFFAWQSMPSQAGLIARFDGTQFTVTRGGMTWFDGQTVAGQSTKVSLTTSAAYASGAGRHETQGRAEELRNISSCILTINAIATELAPHLLQPRALPPANSAWAFKQLRTASIGRALHKGSEAAQGVVEQDFSQAAIRWRLKHFQFVKDGSGVQVSLAGAPFFDAQHASGVQNTVSASWSASTSTGFFAR